jgi:hypothetical protein
MLSTGETLNTWIRNKILTKAGKEVLARTAFNAVIAAVALPLTIYRYESLLTVFDLRDDRTPYH